MKLNVHLRRMGEFAECIGQPTLAMQLEEARKEVLKGCVRASFDKVLDALHDVMLDLETAPKPEAVAKPV